MESLPKTAPKMFCFVLMPFHDDFKDVYEVGIKESCAVAGAYCERVDEQIFQERILDRIYNQIAKADVIIADMTGRNPNVFYEVGYAHALGKATILLTKKADDIPFDLKHFPHVIYEGQIVQLREKLTRQIKYFVDNPPNKLNIGSVQIELFHEGKNIDSQEVIIEYNTRIMPELNLVIQNTSSSAFEHREFKIELITTNHFYTSNLREITSIEIPNKQVLHSLPYFDTVFPQSYDSISFCLWGNDADIGTITEGETEEVTIRAITPQGNREWGVKFRKNSSFRLST